MSKNKQDKVSRRGFISGASGAAASGAAAAGLQGCSTGGNSDGAHSHGGVWERPPNQRNKGNRLNLIFLNTDTFRADNLQAYGGNGLVKCPNLDKFSEDCAVFDDCYPEGMPTIPIRRVLMTGRRILP